ncbi:TPA: trypsin-like peptidase domain-containing protein [Serratia marcescens]|nr:trypsin-like peptidase domain-containing protein [Serratia marcescens]MBH3047556.1 trypsin-like peptidase domain-containing protein [Serratia marcescens]MBH3146959.1 trypsin-like peptidase domain-containing protein [Serratia marcescens]MBN5272390.1 trypsin-like peptidase domain-containing protein [Serratia marcescens]MBN5277497.1 trypsin-like peptidase domain-containing protein [Serratia marcescens]MBN5306071.1 trypsin-like peptidase domain-containing protein [Serratia marcescens]
MLTDASMIYPYLPIGVFVPNWIEKNLTSTLVLDWRSALVSFFVKKEFSTQEAVLVGSGFLYLLDGKVPCIMTASHVITEMRKSDLPFISIDGVKFLFENLEILFNNEQDYAVIPLPKKIAMGIPDSRLFTSIDNTREIKTSSFVIIGYPAKHNKLHRLRPERGLTPFALTFHNFHYDRVTEDIFFHFIPDGKNKNVTFEPISCTTATPSLAGMSGGVIAQIVMSSGVERYSLRAVGSFKEHRAKRGNFLVGTTFIDFSNELNALFK